MVSASRCEGTLAEPRSGADRLQLRRRAAPPALPAAAHRWRWASHRLTAGPRSADRVLHSFGPWLKIMERRY
jgi:hypothetical protein